MDQIMLINLNAFGNVVIIGKKLKIKIKMKIIAKQQLKEKEMKMY